VHDRDPRHWEYHCLLLDAGFTGIHITATQKAGPGLRSAIIQATRPTALQAC
jgi:hypothetical protein